MANITQHDLELDGYQYHCKTFPGTQGCRLINRLGALLDANAFKAFLADDDPDAIMRLNDAAYMMALVGPALRVAEQNSITLDVLAKQILERTWCDNIAIGEAHALADMGNVVKHFDDHFAGNFWHLGKLCMWVLRKSLSRP